MATDGKPNKRQRDEIRLAFKQDMRGQLQNVPAWLVEYIEREQVNLQEAIAFIDRMITRLD